MNCPSGFSLNPERLESMSVGFLLLIRRSLSGEHSRLPSQSDPSFSLGVAMWQSCQKETIYCLDLIITQAEVVELAWLPENKKYPLC